ncbi:MAG: hypothetical protein HN742_15825 [Lentisphaerae bacterium]|jgi:hypothetical protein|nr:hypothetical protein [Lentisphaerota bacterium]MBT4817289.1 hypothetical protein [Lentisphaerota bacterium]MBT5607722.1 hypothetical protein [Lentisphaerota bacterium]MBT7054885.1 hypothetical protein [Lentisphaerota bacterium]MBT7843345.1 hypothetical protein [Lentisphaerota bacterium]
MIPSDHFVRYYNEVFKALEGKGREHLVAYWSELGRLQSRELADAFRQGGIQACYTYWSVIDEEENCDAELALTEDYFELRMNGCPSLSKVLDNDAAPSALYCDHCMGWIEPVMQTAGLHAVMDMRSRTEPHCVFRVYADKALADAFASEAALVSRPYGE